MKIFITGITGFIGQYVLPQLSADDQIFVLSRKSQTGLPAHMMVIEGDLNAPTALFNTLKQIRPDVCMHLAWEGIPDFGFDTSLRNLNQTAALWRYLVEECGCSKIIATGSCWEYGKSFGACREDEQAKNQSYFTWAKQALVGLGETLAAQHGISFIWARLFYVYGPGQREGSLIPSMVDALKKNHPPLVKTAHNANDFIHVDDAARALALMVKANIPTGIYNLGSGQSIAVWQVCAYIEKAMGKEVIHAKQLQKMEIKPTADFWADTSKTQQALTWNTKINIEEGIRRYIKNMEIKV